MAITPFPHDLKRLATETLKGPFLGVDADYIFCTNNGYLMELKGVKLHTVCKIAVNDVSEISLTGKWKGGICNIYYVLYSLTGVLLVVDRSSENKIIEKHENVSRYEICDPQNTGQCAILIWKNDSEDPEMLLGDDIKSCNDEPGGTSVVTGYLESACMDMKMQWDSLLDEVHLKETVVKRYLTEKTPLSVVGAVPAIGDFKMPNSIQPPGIELRDSWQHVHADMWIIGLCLYNTSGRDIPCVRITPKCVNELEYRYKIHIEAKGKPLDFDVNTIVPTASLFYVTVMSYVNNIWEDGSLTLQFEIRCLDDWVTIPEFTITSSQLVQGCLDFFADIEGDKKRSFRKDFISLLHSHTKSTLNVYIPVPVGSKSLRSIFVEEFKMKELQKLGDGFFYCEKGPLEGVLMLIPPPSPSTSQTLRIWMREVEQLFLLVSGLYDLLPYGAKITSS